MRIFKNIYSLQTPFLLFRQRTTIIKLCINLKLQLVFVNFQPFSRLVCFLVNFCVYFRGHLRNQLLMSLSVLYNVVHYPAHHILRALCVVGPVKYFQLFVFTLKSIKQFLWITVVDQTVLISRHKYHQRTCVYVLYCILYVQLTHIIVCFLLDISL